MQVEQSAIAEPPRRFQFGMAWLSGLIAMFFLAGITSLFETTTQIAPAQDSIQDACLYAAIVVALLSAVIGFRQLPNGATAKRLMWAAVVALLGFGSSAFLFAEISSFVEGWIDFPPGKTRTAEETMPIYYAYHHHSRHADVWIVEIADSLIDITPGDADFMLKRRLPGDTSGALGQIWSGGYFCAKLTVQTAGNAKRVLRRVNGLPPGSVILCPKANGPLVRKAQQ
jgi:hypothetical protein